MLLNALLLVSSCLLAPQAQGGERFASVLSKSEQDSLRSKAQEWFKLQLTVRDLEGPRRDAARKKEDAAKEKFLREWEAKSKKRDLLACVGDLKAIFAGCFEFDRQSGGSDVRTFKPKGAASFDAVVPRRYRETTPTPTVLVIRGHGERGWVLANEWWSSTWKGAAEAQDYVGILPQLDDGMDLDPPLDLSKEHGLTQDEARYITVLGAIGSANQVLHLDRERIYLDCAEGSCLFGLRMAATFPQMFAGVILRKPTDPGELRLESLTGLPVLLLRTAATKDVCQKIADALNKLQDGACTLLDAKGDYPHAESGDEIAVWTKSKERDMSRTRVVVANNYDKFRRAYWVQMGTAPSLLEVAADARPYLEVVADRAANRITVTARRVSDFGLYLNDALVDLDKEVTIVVNGQALKPARFERNLRQMCETIYRGRDPGAVFPAERTFVVPAEPTPAKADAVDKGAAGDKGAPGEKGEAGGK